MNELEQKRNEIDAIDKEMAKLFEERMKVCDYIAEYKKTNMLPVFDKDREEKILADGDFAFGGFFLLKFIIYRLMEIIDFGK